MAATARFGCDKGFRPCKQQEICSSLVVLTSGITGHASWRRPCRFRRKLGVLSMPCNNNSIAAGCARGECYSHRRSPPSAVLDLNGGQDPRHLDLLQRPREPLRRLREQQPPH